MADNVVAPPSESSAMDLSRFGFSASPQSAVKPALVGALLNVVLAHLVEQVATPEQVNPSNGAESLDIVGQMVHMVVSHKKVLVSSSILVAVLVGLAVVLSSHSAVPEIM